MAKQQGPNGSNGTESEMFYLLVIVMIVAAVWGIWTYARDVLVYISFGLDLAQFAAIDFFLNIPDDWKQSYELSKSPFGLPNIYETPPEGYWKSIPFEYFKKLSIDAGYLFRFIFAFLIACMALVILFLMKGNKFAKKFSLSGKGGPSLAHYQAEHWKVFSTGAKFNPDDQENKSEAQAMTPMEWMKEHGVTLTESDGLDTEAAYEGFILQLGKPWHGVEKVEPHVKTLCFLLYMNAKRDKNARKYKEELALIWTSNKPEIAAKKAEKFINPLLKKDNKFVKLIEKHSANHAYTNTAMYKLLSWSRKNGGVFASAEFRWLKSIDRKMWYVLNNCGRRAFHTEGAGAVSHYFAENILTQPLSEPHVDQAIDGLEDYLDDQGIMDLEEFFRNETKEL